MTADRIMNLIAPSVIAITAIVIVFLVHPAQKFFFVPAMVVAFVCYLLTSYREMPKPGCVLPIYLVALAIQFLHFTEKYVYGFHLRVTEIMFNGRWLDIHDHVSVPADFETGKALLDLKL